ncbi:hypothetical protein [Amnibacterium setariae]|uniref:Uncharacterized protein n=1 Tax=Amnibacterium setariae TaxID=2306585 RepID=A0A3A1U4L8_9MICO|nr:hypothetical protein [Amnibacterium setariae]RIX28797.1 hypothetical protein D1781_15530 [Amnibacterium setariae]
MSGVSIYFGVEPPETPLLTAIGTGDVVLEPYHPLVQDGGFADVFPHCRRYVYVNPTTVDPWHYDRMADPPPITGRDARWGLPRLDLDRPEALDWAVAQAVAAFAADGARSTGLFVDDLDRMLPNRAELAIEYLARVGERTPHEPRWFLNRGFALWPLVEALDAVLLEDLTPEVVGFRSVDESRWMDEVLAAVRGVRSRGVRVHALSYDDQDRAGATAADRRVQTELAALVDTVTTDADRPLNTWRTSR